MRVTVDSSAQPCAAACLAAAILAGSAAASAATLKDGYPFAPGDTFTYAYSSSTAVKPNCTGTPNVTNLAYTEVTTILPAVQYTIPPGTTVTAYPFRTQATSVTANGTLTINNTDYRNFVKSGKNTQYVDYGFVHVSSLVPPSNITNYDSISRSYLTPLLRDQQPRVKGTKLPLPVAFNEITNHYYVVNGTQSNILQSNETRNADGSFTNGGLTYDVPFSLSQNVNSTGNAEEGPANAPETWTFNLPEQTANGYVIPVMTTYGGQMGTNLVPDWFPGNAIPPNPLTNSSYKDLGTKTVPANCGGAYAGKPATLLQMTYTNLAPVAGYLFSETDDYYVVNKIGRVCMAVTQSRSSYDQEVTGACLSSTTITSEEGLVSETIK